MAYSIAHPPNAQGQKRLFLLAVLVCEILFLAYSWPYMTGAREYVPAEMASRGTFAASQWPEVKLTPRDHLGGKDYFMQERGFLQFYRESILNGELPFWDESNYGGTARENGVNISWISPLHAVWLLVDNDQVAKGIEIFLILNIGLLGTLWWASILGLPPSLTMMAAIFITFTPLATRYDGLSQYGHCFAASLLVTAAFTAFLDSGRRKYLFLFFAMTLFLISGNYMPSLLFVCIVFLMITISRFGWSPYTNRRGICIRTLLATIVFTGAFASLAFYICPILMKVPLRFTPVLDVGRPEGVLANIGLFLQSLYVFDTYGNAHWTYSPYLMIAVTIVFAALLRGNKTVSTPAFWLACIFIFFAAATTTHEMQFALRSFIPGMKYSINGLIRFQYMASWYLYLAMAYFIYQGRKMAPSGWLFLIICLGGVIAFNGTTMALYLFSQPSSDAGFFNKIIAMSHGLTTHVLQAQLAESVIANAIALVFFSAFLLSWYPRWADRVSEAARVAIICGMGAAFLVVNVCRAPNMRAAHDSSNHPIFEGISQVPSTRTITVAQCNDRQYSPGNSRHEAQLAGMTSLDGTGCMSITKKHTQYWYPLNNYEILVAKTDGGLHERQPDVWVCNDRITESDGVTVKPGVIRLFQTLGLDYIFSDKPLYSDEMDLENTIHELRAYRVQHDRSEALFFPNTTPEQVDQALIDLIQGDEQAWNLLSMAKDLTLHKIGNHKQRVSATQDVVGLPGAILVTHVHETNRFPSGELFGMPVESRWEVVRTGEATPLPQRKTPFRIFRADAGWESYELQYGFKHYWVWGAMSVIGLLLSLMTLYRSDHILNKWHAQPPQKHAKAMI